jgi:hypothetical protein
MTHLSYIFLRFVFFVTGSAWQAQKSDTIRIMIFSRKFYTSALLILSIIFGYSLATVLTVLVSNVKYHLISSYTSAYSIWTFSFLYIRLYLLSSIGHVVERRQNDTRPWRTSLNFVSCSTDCFCRHRWSHHTLPI